MNKQLLKVAILSTALLFGTASAYALSAHASAGSGGVSASVGLGGGTSASVNSNSSQTSASVGLGTSAGTTGDTANVNIGTGTGALATVDSAGNPVDGTSATDASVNLGGLLSGLGITDPTAPGTGTGVGTGTGTTPVGLQSAVASLSTNDQRALQIRCRDVLASPTGYTHNVIGLCKLIAGM